MTTSMATVAALAAACLTACAAEPADDRCAAARAHLSECFGAEPADATCDPAAADAILATSCAALVEPGKEDRASPALCRLGVLSRCPVPACAVAAPPATACADYIDREDCAQCDYYLCRDAAAANGCGATGYYQGFGYEYCERYLEVTTPRLSPAGQRFAHDVRRCLMQAMEDTIPVDAACPDVKTAAYASHPDCYLASGFCALPWSDWLAIAATIRPADSSLREMLGTALRCR
ncbi:MAG: hypothetical protein IPH44_38275 [Myxococcales bacterium]|nr:hypothetical protein [Myxococcales bacterium]